MYMYTYINDLWLKFVLLSIGFNDNNTCHGCPDPSGIAFKLDYHIVTGLVPTLLTSTQKGKRSCVLDGFMFLNHKHDLEAVSIVSSCLGINLGSFPIHGLETHIYIFNECKLKSLCNIINATDANIIVWSTFPNFLDNINLGNFFKLLPVSDSNRTGLVATFSKDESHLTAVLPVIRVSLFDTVFKSEAIVNEQQLTFFKHVKLFNKYRVKLSGTISQVTNWEDAAIKIYGIFSNKPGNVPELLCDKISNYIDILYNRSQIEMNNAEAVYSTAVSRYNKTSTTYNMHQMAKTKSNDLVQQIKDRYDEANHTLFLITEKLQQANDRVKSLQKDINNLCTIKKCPEVCIPKQVCEECKRMVTIPIQGTCIQSCTKAEYVTVITGSERETRWEYIPQQNCNTRPSCQVLECVSTTMCETNFISKPVYHYRYKTDRILINTVANCDTPCSEAVVSAPVTALCCANSLCNSTEQDVECLSRNQECTQKREIVFSNLGDTEKDAIAILQSLDEAKRNETATKLQLLRIEANNIFAEKRFNESKRALTNAAATLRTTTVSLETLREKNQLDKLEKAKTFNTCGFTSSFFEIKSVSFATTIITESPTVLAVDVVIFVVLDNITITETLYIDFNNIDVSLKQGAVTIVEKLVLSQNTLSKRHTRSAVNENDNALYFQKKCTDIKNILGYIKDLNASIFIVAESTISSIFNLKDNLLELSKLIKDSSSVFNEEITIDLHQIANTINRNFTHFYYTDIKKSEETDELINLIQEHILSNQELESELENTLYRSWQAKMEDLHNQTKTAAGFPCIGFSGCLQKVVDTLNDLLNDIPLDNINTLSDFSSASGNFMDLALLENYSIVSAVTNTHKIYSIANNPIITDYWCAVPPSIKVHPVKYINSTENSTIKLSCEAEVEQFTSYQWKKDGVQLLGQKNSTLVLTNVTLSDNGNYSCVVTNQVGSTTSFNATVEVLQFPSMILHPTNVDEYLGNLNGVVFQCNASGYPNPGYRWYFQPKETNGFNVIPNSEQNKLTINPPLLKDEGSYYCEAFVGNNTVESKVANLTILHSTVIQVAQTLYLDFSYLSTIEETEVESSGSGNKLLLEDFRKIDNYVSGDFSGSGEDKIDSDMKRNITITPYTKLALEKNLLDVLSMLMSFESTTIENVSLHFVTPTNLTTSFTLYSHKITFSEATWSKINQLAPQAMMEWSDTWQKLQELLLMSGFIITDDEFEYESIPSSLTVDMLQFVCPIGKAVSITNDLICGKLLNVKYDLLSAVKTVYITIRTHCVMSIYTLPQTLVIRHIWLISSCLLLGTCIKTCLKPLTIRHV